MADIPKTRSQLLTLLADNITGAITPQVIRDFLVSVFGIYGSIKAVDNAVPQSLVLSTPAKLITYSKNGLSVGVTPDYANGEVNLPNGGSYILFAQASMKSSVADVNLQARLAIDDTVIDGRFGLDLQTIGKEDSGFCLDIVTVNAAGILSLRAETDKSTDITITNSQLMAFRIG